MSAHRISFRWSKNADSGSVDAAKGLSERLRAVGQDRAADAQTVVRDTATLIQQWILERPRAWETDPDQAGGALEQGLAEWVQNQAWRGACANFLHGLRSTFGLLSAGNELRAGLIQELADWADSAEAYREQGRGTANSLDVRLPAARGVVPHALRTMERGDEVLVHGRSPAIVESLTAAQHAGLFPRVTMAVGAADQSGKRMARHLASHGMQVRLIWDAALVDAVGAADQVWLATEALGSGSFLGLLGSRSLMEAACRLEIPTRVLCTSDACLPGGHLDLPTWGDDEGWNLWSRAPGGIELESQPFEIIDGDSVTSWITEEGRTDLAALCTRHLVLEPASPCGVAHHSE
ncbi:MAG: translation initiation factor 2B subunit (eIF-2B alpha/beta/delta family), partial [Gammaproteobacteria bacterium]